ncbi:MAG: NADH-quinone oxidoreductase subunit C [Planctomycetes bacterium]|nr:NADH-quinone oxidoreductase subunit C [Planctomycetota bacterium]MBL7007418.1 NADH-quinone oxidoreductase subunit C [Planctomycetota bacterium]
MLEPRRDTAWGPMEVLFEAARDAAAALQAAGFEVELHQPNLPVYAPEGESKRLAKKHKEEDPVHEWRGDPYLALKDRSRLLELCRFLRDELGYEVLMDATAVDFDAEDEHLWGVYQFLSVGRKRRLSLKTFIPKADCRVDSVTAVYPAADWHEREASEMFGVEYLGHPDPRHILLPDDWVGHPLRKDYQYPDEYHGISCK